jgi:4-hydroxy-3-polyprenylbenzoate decarboxylase
VPAFYHRPASAEDIIDHTVTRVLDQLGLERPAVSRWPGPHQRAASPLRQGDGLAGGGDPHAAAV